MKMGILAAFIKRINMSQIRSARMFSSYFKQFPQENLPLIRCSRKAFSSSPIIGMKMTYKVEPLPNSVTAVGECPHWDEARQSLYFVDVGGCGKLLRYDFDEKKVYHTQIEGEELASFIAPVAGTPDKFAVGCGRRCVIVQWDGVAEKCKIDFVLFEVQKDPKFKDNRFNDGKCDPCGRLFAGTMRAGGDEFKDRFGELYKYEEGGKVTLIKTDVGISNGLAWNKKAKKFYFIDTTDYDVQEYDYDIETGTPSNPKQVHNFRRTSVQDHIWPDGMTIDSHGNIYVATVNSHTIYKISPRTGKVLLKIKFPVKRVTSAAFGGPNLDILFATTSARFGEPMPAGTTYMVTGLGARGMPMTNVVL